MFNEKEYAKKYRQGHKEYYKEYYKKYNQKHKDEFSEYRKKYEQNNKEKRKIFIKKYHKTEKGKATCQRYITKRRTNLREILNTLTAKEWIDILKEYHFRCAYCGKEFDLFDRPTRDHIIPISKGGDNIKENIMPACRSCNSRKHNKIFKEVCLNE